MIRAAIAEDVAFEREALEKHLRRFAGERGEEVTCDTFENGEALLRAFAPVEILVFRFLLGVAALFVACPHLLRVRNRRQELAFAAAG